MTPEQAQIFWNGLQAYLQEFEKRTGHRPVQTVNLPAAMWTIIEAAGAPREGWNLEMTWHFVPVNQVEALHQDQH